VRYYRWYSNKSRVNEPIGHRQRRRPTPLRSPPLTARETWKGWAALIKQVYESAPLLCPKCGSEMRIIAFIERRQAEVIETILRHCGLWEERVALPPRTSYRRIGLEKANS
jgi:hypothetical protein